MAARKRTRGLIAHRSRGLQRGRRGACRRLAFEPLEGRHLLAATVYTDLLDYAPGATAQVFAAGFLAGETIRFQVLHQDGTPNTGNGHEPWEVTDGSAADLDGLVDGQVHTSWYVDPDDSAGSAFLLTAEGLLSQQTASTTFTDSAPAVRLGAFGNLSEVYENGSLSNSNSSYTEGSSVPYRYAAADAEEGATITLNISYQFQSTTGSDTDHTFDFLTSDNVTIPLTTTNRLGDNSNTLPPNGFDLTALNPGYSDTIAIPDDGGITTETGSREFLLLSNFADTEIVSATFLGAAGDFKTIELVLHMGGNGTGAADEDIVDFALFFGGHLARNIDYVAGDPAHEPNGAADAPGASYQIQIDATQDRPGNITPSPSSNIQAGGVDATSLSWEKRSVDGSLLGGATFSISPNPFGADVLLVDDNGLYDSDPDDGQFRIDNLPFNTYTITEITPPLGYLLDPTATREQTVSAAELHAVVGAQGNDDAGVTNESDFHNAPEIASVELVKIAEPGQVADVVGEAITYTITVTNTGNLTLTGVIVSDPNADTLVRGADAPGNDDGLLEVGETWTYTATHLVTQAELDTNGGGDGALDNTAQVTTTEGASDSDDATVPLTQLPAVLLVKEADPGQIADVAGETITYTITVTNTGNLTLTGVIVSDPNADTLVRGADAPGNDDGLLDVGETWTYTATHLVTQAELDTNGGGDGALDNTAQVTTTEGASDSDDATVPLTQLPAVLLVKEADPGQVADVVGETITYTITVTNTGNLTLTGVIVSDPNADTLVRGGDAPGNDDGLLEVGETWTYMATHLVTQAELDTNGGGDGSLDNTAQVTTTEGASDSDDATVPLAQFPAVLLVKEAEPGQVADVAGETITYIITVTNTGNLTLTGVIVSDPNADTLVRGGDAPGNDDGLLDVGESWTYTATHLVTQAELDSNGGGDGALDNTAQVTSAEGASDSDDATVPLTQLPAVLLVKEAEPGQVADVAGEAITYTITVTNTGNLTLTGAFVSDPNADTLVRGGDAPGNDDGLLDVGESWTYTATHLVTQAELDTNGGGDGALDNTAQVTTTEGASDSDDATVPLTQLPAVLLVKEADPGQVADVAGETITYTITVTNTGNLTLTGVFVSDPNADTLVRGGDAPGNDDGLLDVGESWTYTATHLVTQAELDSNGGGDGALDNTAQVTTTEGASDSDDATVPLAQLPAVLLVKEAEPGQIADVAGEAISYTITVTNTGNLTLTGVVVSDPNADTLVRGGDAPGNDDGLLDVGETWTYTATHLVTQAELDTNGGGDGALDNTAQATTTEGASDSDDATVPLAQLPAVLLVKEAEPGQIADVAGEAITYTITVTNTGNLTLTGVVVSDPNADTLVRGGDAPGNDDGLLEVGETWTYMATHLVTQAELDTNGGGDGALDNTAQVTSAEGASDSDDATVPVDQQPGIDLEKLVADASGVYQDADVPSGPLLLVGDQANFRYLVTNVGNVSLQFSKVTGVFDDGGPDPSFFPDYVSGDENGNGLLDVGETWTFTAARTVTAGAFLNTATATALSPREVTVNDVDVANYFGITAVLPPPPTPPLTPPQESVFIPVIEVPAPVVFLPQIFTVPEEHDSLGHERPLVVFKPFGNAAIHGYAFRDLNGNGFDDDEPLLPGVTVQLFVGGAFQYLSTVTGKDGQYHFLYLTPGTYTVVATPPAGAQATTELSDTVTLGKWDQRVAFQEMVEQLAAGERVVIVDRALVYGFKLPGHAAEGESAEPPGNTGTQGHGSPTKARDAFFAQLAEAVDFLWLLVKEFTGF